MTRLPKDTTMVSHCSVDYRSSWLAEHLQRTGSTRIYIPMGSIFKWANEIRLVYNGETRVCKAHPYYRKWGKFADQSWWQGSNFLPMIWFLRFSRFVFCSKRSTGRGTDPSASGVRAKLSVSGAVSGASILVGLEQDLAS